jgi:hypothetical protein
MANGQDFPTVQIPSFGYTAGTTDIGSGYAKGITAAGEGIAKGVSGALDVMNQNRKTDDMLTAMNQTGILSDDAYKAIAGKSLGAKQGMLGIYASEWIAQQAQEREFRKMGYQADLTKEIEHQKLLDTYNMYKVREPGKFPLNPNQGTPQQPNLAGTATAPTPLGSADITNPLAQQPGQLSLITGAPIGGKQTVPKNWQLVQVRGQTGYMEPDQRTFHPFQPMGTQGQLGSEMAQR